MKTLQDHFPVLGTRNPENDPSGYFMVADKGNPTKNEFWIRQVEYPHYVSADLDAVYAELATTMKELTRNKQAQSIEHAKSLVQKNAGRGKANVEYENFVFYHGISSVDSMASVLQKGEQYYLFLNPRAADYIERVS